jgi:hypothetical protein
MQSDRAQRRQRQARFTARLRRAFGAALLTLGLAARANAQVAPPLAAADPARANVLAITVITAESSVPTLRERVASWFNDGTQVEVGVAGELPSERIFVSSPQQTRVWVVLVSPERAVVMFSAPAATEPARYLLREVRLVNGLDELGLERLASVIHSAATALREGVEGSERPQVERELVSAGLLQDTGSAPPLVASSLAPPAAPAVDTQRTSSAARNASDFEGTSGAHRAGVLLAGYGMRLRGAEGLGHGPLVAAGVRMASTAYGPLALVGVHWLFRSEFDAGPLAASVRTTAFRAHLGFEPALSRRVKLQALFGGGADLARIDARASADSTAEQIRPRAAGNQWRGALELTLGVWWQTSVFDWGATAHTTLLLGDVHYSVEAAGVEQRLVAPWRVQPGLSLQGRFRSAP